MSLTKVNYIDNSTIITAKNLNDIQDNIIQNSELVKKVAPRNLLDNSDFRNPVNQRGYARYTSESKPETGADPNTCYGITQGSTIDRWGIWSEAGNTSFTVHKGYITFSASHHGTLYQRFEKGFLDSSKSYTLVVKKPNEPPIVIYPAYIIYEWSVADTITLADLTNGNSVSFEWVALYEGEYTLDNLPEYQPKGYGAELAECMRYYQTYKDDVIWLTICPDGYTRCTILFNTPMRIAPTLQYTFSASNTEDHILQGVTKNGFRIDTELGNGWGHITNLEAIADL